MSIRALEGASKTRMISLKFDDVAVGYNEQGLSLKEVGWPPSPLRGGTGRGAGSQRLIGWVPGWASPT